MERWTDPYNEGQDPEPTPTSVHIGLIVVFCAVFLVVIGLLR